MCKTLLFLFVFFFLHCSAQKRIYLNGKADGAEAPVYKMLDQWDNQNYKLQRQVAKQKAGCMPGECEGIRYILEFTVDSLGHPVNIKWDIYGCRTANVSQHFKKKLNASLATLIFPEASRKKCYSVMFGWLLKC